MENPIGIKTEREISVLNRNLEVWRITLRRNSILYGIELGTTEGSSDGIIVGTKEGSTDETKLGDRLDWNK